MTAAAVERIELAPGYDIARIINGGWQLSHGHHASPTDRSAALAGWERLVEAGFTTFDGADIYGGVEELFGRFLARLRRAGLTDSVQIHTKCVPDLEALAGLRRRHVVSIVDRSLRRLGAERLDLVQFHWWDYRQPGYLDAMGWLEELRQQGKIRHLGVTNFDTRRLREMLDAGIPIVSNQVQYSLLDRRPAGEMAALCAQRGVHLLCYGSLAGGFLTPSYLARSEIHLDEAAFLANRSLTKYRLIIEEFGGWDLYQELLQAMARLAEAHDVESANVAVRWVLQRPSVAAAIVGTRTGAHLESNGKVFSPRLEGADLSSLNEILNRGRGPSGSVFGLERLTGGRHQSIMKTNLNAAD